MQQVYETTNHFYNLQVQVSQCSQCGQRTMHFSASSTRSICDACAANEASQADSQEQVYSQRLHMHLHNRFFGQAR